LRLAARLLWLDSWRLWLAARRLRFDSWRLWIAAAVDGLPAVGV
jgi:hypothetical protein